MITIRSGGVSTIASSIRVGSSRGFDIVIAERGDCHSFATATASALQR